MTNRLITYALVASSAIFVYQIAMLQRDYKEFNRRMVWNIDEVRNLYLQDVQFSFKRGCFVGVDYPQEFRKKQTGWNENSPPSYCDKAYKEKIEDYFFDQLGKLGRSPQ